MTLYCWAVLCQKNENGRVVSSLVQGYNHCSSENEARGIAYSGGKAKKPDLDISQILVLEIPKEDTTESDNQT